MKTTQLAKKYSGKELAESFVFRNKLSKKHKAEAGKQLAGARKAALDKMAPEQKLLARLTQLRFQIEDCAVAAGYDDKLNFGHFLREYLNSINIKDKEFAADIHINHTELSQIINRHRTPSDKVIIRLEIHSGSTIPAIAWYRLLEKEKEHRIATNAALRRSENQYVKNRLSLQPAKKRTVAA